MKNHQTSFFQGEIARSDGLWPSCVVPSHRAPFSNGAIPPRQMWLPRHLPGHRGRCPANAFHGPPPAGLRSPDLRPECRASAALSLELPSATDAAEAHKNLRRWKKSSKSFARWVRQDSPSVAPAFGLRQPAAALRGAQPPRASRIRRSMHFWLRVESTGELRILRSIPLHPQPECMFRQMREARGAARRKRQQAAAVQSLAARTRRSEVGSQRWLHPLPITPGSVPICEQVRSINPTDLRLANRAPAALPRVPRRTTAAAEARMNLRRRVKLSKRSALFHCEGETRTTPGQSRRDRRTSASSAVI